MSQPETATISKSAVEAFFRRWEEDHRAGKCIPYEEARAQSIDEVVNDSTERFWASVTGQAVSP